MEGIRPEISGDKGWRKFLADHYIFICLAGIVLLASFLRLYKLDYKSLWIDELYSVVSTNPINTIGFIINYCKSDQPPAYFLLLHFWFKIFAYNSFYARLLSVVIGVLGVVAMYFLGKEIKSRNVGLIASFLCCLNYYHIYYSQEARFYGLMFLLTVISFLFFIKVLKHRKLFHYFLYVICTIALLYTQYFGILVFGVEGLLFLIYVIWFKEGAKFIVTGIFLSIIITVSFIPWMSTVISDSQITSYWVERPKPYFLAVYYYLYWGKDVLTGLMLAGISLLYFRYWIKLFSKEKEHRFEIFMGVILISWIVLSYAIPYLRSILATPMLIPRYTLITLPAIFIVIALGIDLIRPKRLKTLLMPVLIGLAFINLFLIQQHYTKLEKSEWREAASEVITKYSPGTLVYSNLEWWYNFYFYTTDPRIFVIGHFPTNEELDLQRFIGEIENKNEFWLLSAEATDNGITEKQREFVDRNFRVKEEHQFFQSSAILFEKK